MPLQPIEPEDSRIEHKYAVLNGYTYHYLYGLPPSGQAKATIFLVSALCLTYDLPVAKPGRPLVV